MRLILLLLIVFLLSCSRDSEDPAWEPQSLLGGKIYNGGLFPVWITLKEEIKDTDTNAISWRLGAARIAKRARAIDAKTNTIKVDTAFLYWEFPPTPAIITKVIDSTKTDTTYFYRDTIFAIVNGRESIPIVIEVKNILPHIISISVNGLEQQSDSVFTIATHPGGTREISIRLGKRFGNQLNPDISMPEIMKGLSLKSRSGDSLWIYEWRPTGIIADSSELRIKDSGGHGERLYKVRIVVYTESGSVWVASADELVKYSPTGTEVARIKDDFNSISALAVNSNNGNLFVTDRTKNSLTIYDTYGKQLHRNIGFTSPTGVAVNLEGNRVWVADESGLQSFPFDGSSLGTAETPSGTIEGIIRGLAVDQFKSDLTWFAIPQKDQVGYVEDLVVKYLTPTPTTTTWNRPSTVSLDPASGVAWIADSSRVMAIDASGEILAKITDFEWVGSVSANGGNVWISDRLAGKVYRWTRQFKGQSQDLNLSVTSGVEVKYKFQTPVSISALTSGGAWVVDRDAGLTVHLDKLGNITASGTGLTLPNLSATLQKAD